MANTKILTDVAIRKFKAPAKGQHEVYDGEVKGLGIRISVSGAKSWTFMYRFAGRKRRMTLGRYPNISLKDAREMAREASRVRYEGLDPVMEKAKLERLQTHRYDATFGSLAHRFMREYERGTAHFDNPNTAAPLHRTWKQTQQMLDRNVLPFFDKIPVADITRADIRAVLAPVVEYAPYQANKIFAVVRKLFNWAVEAELIEMSPCTGMRKPFKPSVRNHPLSEEQIRAFWEACLVMGYPYGDAFRLLLVTGQRRTEVTSMSMGELDLKNRECTLGPERTKAKRRHVVPLSPIALDILRNVPELSGPYLFSTRVGEYPISGFSKATNRLRELSGLEDFRLHDLRETMATTMRERLSITTDVIGQVLNHAPQGVTQVHYASVPSLADKRSALKRWDSYLGEVLGGAQPDNVVSFSNRGA